MKSPSSAGMLQFSTAYWLVLNLLWLDLRTFHFAYNHLAMRPLRSSIPGQIPKYSPLLKLFALDLPSFCQSVDW